MDIYLATSPDILRNKLEQKGFRISKKSNHFSAMHYVRTGRYHILYLALEGKVFCDFHFDNRIHGVGMGADYGKQPEEYFEKKLRQVFDTAGISYEISHVNWFTRKNKAIITGFRL